ncbi:MAG: hypothetical protein ACJ8R9_19285 [Steroidobacteraceae bacterium]
MSLTFCYSHMSTAAITELVLAELDFSTYANLNAWSQCCAGGTCIPPGNGAAADSHSSTDRLIDRELFGERV